MLECQVKLKIPETQYLFWLGHESRVRDKPFGRPLRLTLRTNSGQAQGTLRARWLRGEVVWLWAQHAAHPTDTLCSAYLIIGVIRVNP